MFSKKTISLFVVMLFFLLGFSILTDDDGRYRAYVVLDLPFEYMVHDSTTEGRITAIQNGANAWNYIKGCYFQFSFAGKTPVNGPGQDGINLVYLDDNYDNFTPNSNVIAFSSTFTSGFSKPAYRAIESDLIYNSADFPPALNVEGLDPDKQDLQSIIAHEFGHHMGLGHAGKPGSPPGVGQDIPDATMFGTGPSGDTTARSLHIDDIAGAIAIYPRWKLNGFVIDGDSETVITDFLYFLDGDYVPIVGDRVFVTVNQRPGNAENNQVEVTDVNGGFELISFKDSINISIQAFGYEDLDTLITLGDSSSVNETSITTFQLTPKPKFHVTFKFVNQGVLDTVHADMNISSIGLNVTTLIEISTNPNKEATYDLPSGLYGVDIFPELPYARLMVDSINIFSDTTIVFDVIKADYLLIDDDFSSAMGARYDRESFYFDFFKSKNIETYAYRNLDEKALPELEEFQEIPFLIWFTGNNDNALIDSTALLKSYLQNGGKLLLTGNRYVSTLSDTLFLKEMFNIEFAGLNSGQLLKGEAGDPIGQDEFIGIAVASPEKIKILGGAGSSKVFTYTGQTEQGAIKYEGQYKAVIYSFGIDEILDNFDPTAVFQRTLDWLNQPTGIIEIQNKIPQEFSLLQNFPNPFNPKTIFGFALPEQANITLTIYNSIGQKVAELLTNANYQPGKFRVHWEAKNDYGATLATGVYVYRLKAVTEKGVTKTFTKKMLLIK